jgi:hypothetical protein
MRSKQNPSKWGIILYVALIVLLLLARFTHRYKW